VAPVTTTETRPALGWWTAASLSFFSSAAVLVIEIIAGRLMAPYVGVSLETFTGIIGTVLAGIAAGSALGGRWADRHDARQLLGPMLVLGGVLAWLSLPIVTVLGPSIGRDPGGIVLLTAAAFFLPAAVLSTISPMAAKLNLGDLDETGSVVGGLSAAGTAGAILGTFITGFVLVAALPSRPIVVAVGIALVTAGALLWARLRARPPGLLSVAGVFAALLVGSTVQGPCEIETGYFCVQVDEDPQNPSGRILWLDDLRHSYVDLDDPTHLEFRYVRLLADVADGLPEGPLDVLHIGGGGFTFPRYLTAERPGSQHVVLEIDDELVRIARDELGLRTGPDLEVRTGDARLAFGDLPDDGYDLIVGDAFGSASVPWHLTTTEVVAELDRMLRPGGIYAMNLIDGGPNRFAEAQLATLARHFDHLAVIVPSAGVGDFPVNQILVASDQPLPPIEPATGDGRVLTGDEVASFIDGARPLRDDFAPVDQLITHG
jgi:SAM-dependent methyltransferase